MCWTRQHLSCRPLSHHAAPQLPGVFANLGHRRSVPSAAKCSAAWQHWRLWVAGSDAKAALILGSTFRRKATTFMVLLLHGAEGMFVPLCFMLFGILPAEESCRPAFLRCPFLDLLFISAFLPHPFAMFCSQDRGQNSSRSHSVIGTPSKWLSKGFERSCFATTSPITKVSSIWRRGRTSEFSWPKGDLQEPDAPYQLIQFHIP